MHLHARPLVTAARILRADAFDGEIDFDLAGFFELQGRLDVAALFDRLLQVRANLSALNTGLSPDDDRELPVGRRPGEQRLSPVKTGGGRDRRLGS